MEADTATHLLQWALQNVLGKSVAQQGSYVGPDYLRFDFTFPKALSAEELQQVEDLVRKKILADLPVTWAVLPKDQAQELGAMALFGEKYGSEVRVVAVGVADSSFIRAEINVVLGRKIPRLPLKRYICGVYQAVVIRFWL